jgi:hypothetical protein
MQNIQLQYLGEEIEQEIIELEPDFEEAGEQ